MTEEEKACMEQLQEENRILKESMEDIRINKVPQDFSEETVKEYIKTADAKLKECLKKNPTATLLGVFGVGILIGKIFDRK